MCWTVPEPCPNLLIEYFLDFCLLKVVYRLKVDWLMEYLEFQLVRLLVLGLDFPFLKFHEFLYPGIFFGKSVSSRMSILLLVFDSSEFSFQLIDYVGAFFSKK